MMEIGLSLTKNDKTAGSAGASYVLEDHTGAAHGYSLRKLTSTYTGSAVRVRRDSDDTEQDIGFVDGELDAAALTTFVGANNGFVTKWYDQVGSEDAVNAVTTSQPHIAITGTIPTMNSIYTIQFGIGSSTTAHLTAAGASRTQPHTQVVAFETYSGSGSYYILDNLAAGSSGRASMYFHNATYPQLYGGSVLSAVLDAGAVSGDTGLVTGIYNGASSLLAYNGATTTGNAGSDNPSGLDIGLSTSTSRSRKIAEVLIFDTDYSSGRVALEASVNEHYTLY